MRSHTGICVGSALAIVLCAACTSAPDKSADAEYRAPPIYRTGSNIPTKDYGADNVEVRGAEVVNPINRPMGNVLNKKPGG